ncbi:MAG TPA: hypothetical protein VKI43_04555 [Vicinamibacterales bacterium]|nr:hypothetical protein [Vicinamibacterales bacterium]
MNVERRDFLFLRAGQPAVLSCERLFMRFLDSQMDDTTGQLFDNLAVDLRKVNAVQLTDLSWLSRADLKAQLDSVLAAFTSRGGRIV